MSADSEQGWWAVTDGFDITIRVRRKDGRTVITGSCDGVRENSTPSLCQCLFPDPTINPLPPSRRSRSGSESEDLSDRSSKKKKNSNRRKPIRGEARSAEASDSELGGRYRSIAASLKDEVVQSRLLLGIAARRCPPTAGDISRVRTAMSQGFTPDDMRLAIRRVGQEPSTAAKYLTLSTILRPANLSRVLEWDHLDGKQDADRPKYECHMGVWCTVENGLTVDLDDDAVQDLISRGVLPVYDGSDPSTWKAG